MKYILGIFCFFTFGACNVVAATQCSSVFPDGVQSNTNNGTIDFGWQSKVVNSPDNVLATNNLNDNSGGVSCNTTSCAKSNSPAFSIDFNSFPNNNNDIYVGYQQTLTLAPGAYKKIQLDSEAILTLSAGDYIVTDTLEVGYLSKINISGSGVVRILVKKQVNINSSAAINQNGNATQLLLYSRDNIFVGYSSTVNGFVYSKKDVTLNSSSVITGAVSAKNVSLLSSLLSSSSINFVNQEPDFGNLCTGATATPIANYHFDECAYTGTTNEVIDQLGTYNGQSFGGLDTFASGQIERAANISSANHHIETSIPISGDFSVSTWFKKPTATDGSRYFILGSMAAGGDLLFLDRNNNWRWGVYNPDVGSKYGSFRFDSLDNNWHHLALIYSGGETKLYIDGVFTDSVDLVPSGTLKYIGTSFDQVGTADAQGFRAPLDEFIVFNNALNANDILTIYNNQLAGNNYDGTRRSGASCLVDPIVYYRLDETSWSGSTGDVADFMGNLNGTSKNGVVPNKINPALAGNPGTCGYGEFDGQNDYIQIDDNPLLDLPNELTVSVWIYPKSLPSSGLKTIISKDENFEFHLNSQGEIFWWWQKHNFSTTGATIQPNKQWYHVAVTFKNGEQVIYVNGQPLGTRHYSETLPTNNDPLQIGQDQNFRGRYFNGLIDEVKIYDVSLSADQIAALYRERHICAAASVDHYQIEHDGTGLTCESETVTIKACADASCSVLSNDSVSLDLQGNGTTLASVNFQGSATVSFNHTVAETLNLSIANATIVPTQNTQCVQGNTNSCDLTFANAGLQFLYSSSNSLTIDNQVSGETFAEPLKIRAVKDNAGVCTGLFNGDVPITLAQTNVNPAVNTGLDFAVNGTTIAKAPSGTEVTLHFDGNAIADIPNAVYYDAGQIQLTAQYSGNGLNIVGNSNNFWVAPKTLTVNALSADGTTVLNGNSHSSAVTQKAGNDFIFQVSAKNSQGVVTPNYQPGQLQLKLQRVAPVLGSDGQLSVNNETSVTSALSPNFTDITLSAFNQGVSSFSAASYSEVGIIATTVQDSNYGGVGLVVNGTTSTIGRFIPDHFEQTVVEHGVLTSICQLPTTFAYSGQKDEATNSIGAISYLTSPKIRLTAYNKQGQITVNYWQDSEGSANDFMPLSANDVQAAVSGLDSNNNLPYDATINTGTLTVVTGGIIDYQFSLADHFTYQRSLSAQIAPFISGITFDNITAQDTDGVSLTNTQTVMPAGVEIRFGRMVLANSYGPETAALTQPLSIEYFDGNGFVKDTENNCSGYDAAKLEFSYISLSPSLTSVSGGTGIMTNGETRAITLSAPGSGNRGEIGVSYHSFDWFKYDWNNDGNLDDMPSAVATFGQYRGNDRIIYWRETSR